MDRESAPFGQNVWDQIDAVAASAAAEVRAGRRILAAVGPLGFDARVGVAEDVIVDEADDRASVLMPRARALPVLQRQVELGARTIEATEKRGQPLLFEGIAEAARVIARTEDRLLFEGLASAGLVGLTGHPGAIELGVGDWS
ncbi:MAG TPA: family 1 encapsulin nanocompartment shell protein, partial [Anaeromyxobacteraceae bacterium]|nr:family 1 encapsulin nanocompartment shell protein [Anaeromyxobacteraceae bacterium]